MVTILYRPQCINTIIYLIKKTSLYHDRQYADLMMGLNFK